MECSAPDRRLGHLVVDDHVGLMVFSEGGPGNWDSTLASVGISGQEDSAIQ